MSARAARLRRAARPAGRRGPTRFAQGATPPSKRRPAPRGLVARDGRGVPSGRRHGYQSACAVLAGRGRGRRAVAQELRQRALNNCALVLLSLRPPLLEEALCVCEEVLRTDPLNAKALWRKGSALQQLGRAAEADEVQRLAAAAGAGAA
eukprot:TRINITY_DN6303_c1_g1_i1.p1 TRINITY_DN6303_c1_g1~~TRINITY_DN6303_c1_g1_i1.p1  ORF type:complete len:150 (+),score=26.47 TRINITY_DN6303_c1_g1_i1:184-633(+)